MAPIRPEVRSAKGFHMRQHPSLAAASIPGAVAFFWMASTPPASAQVAAGPEFRVPQQTAGPQIEPSAGSGSNGDFVVAWTRAIPPTEYDVYGRRFSAAG